MVTYAYLLTHSPCCSPVGEVHLSHVLFRVQDLNQSGFNVIDKGMELGQVLGMEKENVQLSSIYREQAWIQETVEDIPQGGL